MKNIYGVYENGVLINQGDANELCDMYYIAPTTIYYCEKNGRLLEGKYVIKFLGLSEPKVKIIEEPKLSQFEEEINEIVRRLRIYGNTTLPRIKNGELDKYLQALKENGCDVIFPCSFL